LDIQVVIGATRGLVPIRIYKAENKVSDFARAIRLCGKEGNCSALSISWGAPEKQYTETVDMESALEFAASQGISIFSASGDGGSSDGQDGDNADYPASSKSGCGVGGTTILKESPLSEAAWNSGGGGYSKLFKLPVWQSGNTAYDGNGFRGVPDVAANADPNTGYPIWVNGQKAILGGTSAAAPLWASLCAIFAELLGRKLGNIAPLLYAHQLDVPRPTVDITAGSNGDFQTAVGWDPCTGLGTPVGGNMAKLLGIREKDKQL
jgi:kumamolisin